MEREAIKKAIGGVLEICKVIVDTAKEVGPVGIPTGPLYATLMSHMDLDTFNKMIKLCTDTGLIENKNHVLYYKKPTGTDNVTGDVQ